MDTKALRAFLVAPDVAAARKEEYWLIRHSEKAEAIRKITNGLTWERDQYDEKKEAALLAVAHMDTALNIRPPHINHHGVVSAALDDRLGAFVILWVLGHLPFDVLLTTGEEQGRSSAQMFTPGEHKYNWVFSFDRRGTGAVLYQYDNKEMRKRLKSVGVDVQLGSFSDISYLGHLGVSGINFGVGYNGEHSHSCYAKFSDVAKCVGNFHRFFRRYADTKMPHTEPKRWQWSWMNSDYRGYGGTWRSPATEESEMMREYSMCDYCTEYGMVYHSRHGFYLCADCYDWDKVSVSLTANDRRMR